MVGMTYTCGGGCEELIVASICHPYDSDEPLPTEELGGDVTDYCCSRKNQLILGRNANNTIHCGGAPAVIPVEKTSWNFW
jgi:hypothetical protein